MSLLSTLQQQITQLQTKINILQNAPEDTYPFGTIAVVAYQTGKQFYVKVGEETWRKMDSGNVTSRPLSEWILESYVGNSYFEVYIMTTAEIPIYASA